VTLQVFHVNEQKCLVINALSRAGNGGGTVGLAEAAKALAHKYRAPSSPV